MRDQSDDSFHHEQMLYHGATSHSSAVYFISDLCLISYVGCQHIKGRKSDRESIGEGFIVELADLGAILTVDT